MTLCTSWVTIVNSLHISFTCSIYVCITKRRGYLPISNGVTINAKIVLNQHGFMESAFRTDCSLAIICKLALHGCTTIIQTFQNDNTIALVSLNEQLHQVSYHIIAYMQVGCLISAYSIWIKWLSIRNKTCSAFVASASSFYGASENGHSLGTNIADTPRSYWARWKYGCIRQ